MQVIDLIMIFVLPLEGTPGELICNCFWSFTVGSTCTCSLKNSKNAKGVTNRVCTRSENTWKPLDFGSPISRSWKYLKLGFGLWKSLIFYWTGSKNINAFKALKWMKVSENKCLGKQSTTFLMLTKCVKTCVFCSQCALSLLSRTLSYKCIAHVWFACVSKLSFSGVSVCVLGFSWMLQCKASVVHPGGGGGTRDFKWRGWSNGAKRKSLGLPAKPKKIPGPKMSKINPQKIQCWFCCP